MLMLVTAFWLKTGSCPECLSPALWPCGLDIKSLIEYVPCAMNWISWSLFLPITDKCISCMSASWSVPDFIHFAGDFLASFCTGDCSGDLPARPGLVWQVPSQCSPNLTLYIVSFLNPREVGCISIEKAAFYNIAWTAWEARRNGV